MIRLTSAPAARTGGSLRDPSALPTLAVEQDRDRAAPLAQRHPRRAFVAQLMGLPVSVHVRGPRAQSSAVADTVEAAFAALRTDEAMFSTWRSGSAVSRIRRGELRLRDAEPRVRQVAELCEKAADRTAGYFSAWLPGPDGQSAFDPSGLVKGWAAEQAFEGLMRRLGVLGDHDGLLCAGGDVVVACGRNDTPDWLVGVENPRERTGMLRTVALRRGAVATSGTAARGAHIVNPVTGQPASGLLSATVVGPALTWADVYATAAFARGDRAADWVGTLTGHTALLVATDGAIRIVTGPAAAAAWGTPATQGYERT